MTPRRWNALAAVALVVGLAAAVGGSAPAAGQVSAVSTERLSVSDAGDQAAGASMDPAVSADGNHVVFTTDAPLDPLDGDDVDLDVYVRDRATGRTTMLSRGQVFGGGSAMGAAPRPTVRAGATAGIQAFGVVAETEPDGPSYRPSISADGRYVAFESLAGNFTSAGTDFSEDIVVVDRDPDGDGVFDERVDTGSVDGEVIDYRYVLVGRRGVDGLGVRLVYNTDPSISADGTVVAWVEIPEDPTFLRSRLLAAAPPDDSDLEGDVAVTVLAKDAAGRLEQPGPEHPVFDADGAPPGHEIAGSAEPVVAADGRRVVAVAQLRPEGGDETDLGIIEMTVPEGLTSRLDRAPDGTPLPGWVGEPTVSADGRMVGFTWEEPGAGRPQVLVVDRDPDADGLLSATGADEPFDLRVASRDTAGEPGGGQSSALSSNGRYLAFVTSGRMMHNGVDRPEDAGRCLGQPTSVCDVVVRDLAADAEREALGLPRLPAELASQALGADCAPPPAEDTRCEGGDDSAEPALSATGDVVVYQSSADDLVPDDTNDAPDVFARQFRPTLATTPPAVDLGSVTLGSDNSAGIAFDHVGFGPLQVGRVVIDGPDAPDFAVFPAETCGGRTFHATGGCAVSVRFTPTAPGARAAVLRLDDPDGLPLVTVSLSGGGEAVPVRDIEVGQDELAFAGRIALSSSPPRSTTVRNTGTAPVAIGQVGLLADPGAPRALHPEDYAVTGDACSGRTLAVGASCAISITHTPRGVGARAAVLAVPSDAETGLRLVRLTGAGAAPSLEVNPGVVRDSGVTTVRGRNFPPGQLVTVSTAGIAGLDLVVTDAGGGFTLSYVVLPNAARGNRTVAAAFVGVTPPIRATADVLVVPGSVAPPDFSRRR